MNNILLTIQQYILTSIFISGCKYEMKA